jgi:hypothetical protein
VVPKSGEAGVIGPLSRTDRFSNQSAMEEKTALLSLYSSSYSCVLY